MEVPGDRTATSTTYVNPDGSSTVELTAAPTRVRRGGKWLPVDTDLQRDGNGDWATAATTVTSTFSGGGDSAAAAKADTGGLSTGFGFGAKLPVPDVDGSTATYRNVLPNIDLIEVAGDGGFSLSLRLRTRPTRPVTFTLPLKLTGLTATQDPATGALTLSDSTGTPVFRTAQPIMYDGARDPHSDEPLHSAVVDTQLINDKNGSRIVVSPDWSFLSDPDVTYPVTIDPDATLDEMHYTFTSSEFSSTSYWDNTITENGTTGILHVGTYNSGTDRNRGYYRFNTSTIVGHTVTSATFRAKETWAWSCNAREVDVYEPNANVTSSTTWSNQPGLGTKLDAVSVAKGWSSSCPAGTVDFDVTSAVKGWSNDASGAKTLSLVAADNFDNYYWKKFAGSSGKVLVNFANVPTAPASVTATPGDQSVSVTWTPPSSNGGSAITNYHVTYYKRVVNAPDTIVYQHDVASTARSDSHGGLTNGQDYRVTVEAKNSEGTGPATNSGYVTPSTYPSAVRNLTLGGGDNRVFADWDAPADNGGLPVDKYLAYLYPAGSTWPSSNWIAYKYVTSGTSTYFQAGDGSTCNGGGTCPPTNGTAYDVVVFPHNTSPQGAVVGGIQLAAGFGPPTTSSNATAQNYPSAPRSVTASPRDGQVSLNWTPPADTGGPGVPLVYYFVSLYPAGSAYPDSTSLYAWVDPSLTTYTFTGLTNGTSYTGYVWAKNNSIETTSTNGTQTSAGTSPAGISNAATPAGRPGSPTNVAGGNTDSAGHTVNNAIIVSWDSPSNNGAAITKYYVRTYSCSSSSATSCSLDVTQPTITSYPNGQTGRQYSPAITPTFDGYYAFDVQADNTTSGNPDTGTSAWSAMSAPYLYAATGPGAPVINSPDHDSNTWSTNRDATFTWTVASPSAPVIGYSVAFDEDAATIPPPTVNDGTPAWTQQNITDGTHWLHVRAEDAGGRWGPTGSYRVLVDGSTPVAPAVTSSTDPDPGQEYNTPDPAFSWTGPTPRSGVAGYSYVLDQDPSTVPDTVSEGTGTSTSYSGLDDGVYYFHVRALNGAGTWGDTATFEIQNWELADAQAGPATSDTPASGPVPAPLPLDTTALVPAPASGLGPIFPALDGLGHLFPAGGLLGTDSFFGGEVLPSHNFVGDTLHAFGSWMPPAVPAVNIGGATSDVLGQLGGQLPPLEPYFSLIKSLTYQVDTTPYDSNGQPGQTSTFTAPICVPTFFNSSNGATGLPSDYNMRVDFCPDASTFDPADPSNQQGNRERATYQLDALSSSVRVKVQITFLVNGEQLRLLTDARTVDHPVDDGSGSAITSGYACSNGSITTPTPIPGVTFPSDTANGYCLELTAQPHSDGSQTVELNSDSSGTLDNEQLFLDAAAGSGFTPLDHLTAGPVPASTSHHYTLTALTSSSTDDLNIALQDSLSNSGEVLTLERYDTTSGNVQTRLQLSNVPRSFSTDVKATYDNQGNVTDSTITGSQLAASTETLVAQRNDSSGNPQYVLNLGDFPSDYTFDLKPVRDSNGTEIGASTSEHFANGVPAGTRLQLAEYSSNALTALLDESGFADDSTFEVQATGDPANPTGAVVDTTNSSQADSQLIQVLRYPGSGGAQRLVLAGPTALEQDITAPVDGQNLRWDQPPQNAHTTLSETLQTSGPGQGTPGMISIAGTASPMPASTSRIAVTQLSGSTMQGLILGAPTTNHNLRIDVVGSVSSLSSIRIQRDNNTSRPEQALQLYQENDSGLRAQMRFLGPNAVTSGLISGSGDQINGVATNMADDFSVKADLTTDSSGRPTDAVISGTNNVNSPNEDLQITDNTLGFAAHLASLETAYTYTVHAGAFDNNGNPTTASISAADQPSDNPTGLIDLTYAPFRYLAQSLNTSYTDTFTESGPVTDPTRATISRSQSGGNPNALLQVSVTPSSANSPRLAVSVIDGTATPILAEHATYADAVWTGSPASFTLDVGRTANSSGGSASISAQLPADSPGSDLVLRELCSAGRTNCTGRQELHAHGLATNWQTQISYTGTASDPTDIQLTGSADARHANDTEELLNYDSGGLSERLAVHAAGVGTTGGSPSAAEADWNEIPASFSLHYSRTLDGQSPVTQTVAGTASTDSSDSEFQATQTDSDGTQQKVTMHGVAPSWSVTESRKGSGADPNDLRLTTTSSTRHGSDYLQGVASDSNGNPQNEITLAGTSANPPSLPQPAVGALAYDGGYPESVTMHYQRQKYADGSDSRFAFSLTNSDASGNPVPSVAGSTIAATLYAAGQVSEKLNLSDIPQQISNLSYDLPPLSVGSNSSDNCLGTIGYSASDSNLVLKLVQDRPTNCTPFGELRATINGMPSNGFATTVFNPDGSAQFATNADSSGALQVIPSVSLKLPVPVMARDFITKRRDINGENFCPDVGSFAGVHLGCTKVTLTSPQLSVDSNLAVQLDATNLSRVAVATNMGGQDWRTHSSDTTDASIRDTLWNNLPLFGVRNDSGGTANVRITGTMAADATVHQHVDCCVNGFGTAHFDANQPVLAAGDKIGLRFYGWTTRYGPSCTNPNGSGSQTLLRCNAQNQELDYSRGQMFHLHLPFGCCDSIPFDPSFTAYPYDDTSKSAFFSSDPGTVNYYVPDIEDGFFADSAGQGLWWARNISGTAQTDWFWESVPREYPPDPLGLASGG